MCLFCLVSIIVINICLNWFKILFSMSSAVEKIEKVNDNKLFWGKTPSKENLCPSEAAISAQ